ncbi:MAG: hypothetical protein ABIK28_04330, partial [Planctomycetota bacterium]
MVRRETTPGRAKIPLAGCEYKLFIQSKLQPIPPQEDSCFFVGLFGAFPTAVSGLPVSAMGCQCRSFTGIGNLGRESDP